jgi:hypothetical protein
VRAARVTADGRVMLTAAGGHASVIAVEDEAGEAVQAPIRVEQSSGAA